MNGLSVPNVAREIERRGIPIARLTLGVEAVDAFSVQFARRPVMLLTKDKSNYVRSRFDSAHELAHLVSHRVPSPRDKRLEHQAQIFASAFLFPREEAERLLPRRIYGDGWRRLAELKSQWGISMAALLMRGKRLGVLPPDAYKSAVRFMASRGWHRTEPGDREMGPPEVPVLLDRALRTLEAEYSLTVSTLAAEANLPLADMLELIAATNDPRPVVALH
jgi:Zn-dependent peptidase ImmA (M78 family)